MTNVIADLLFIAPPCTCTSIAVTVADVVADIDECAEHSDNCSPVATCLNVEGSFTCVCNSGYTGNGVHCEGNNINAVITGF